jgi:hypothetical protein
VCKYVCDANDDESTQNKSFTMYVKQLKASYKMVVDRNEIAILFLVNNSKSKKERERKRKVGGG